jgi:hypothetical protein
MGAESSYPYLNLAKLFGVDYGDVLSFADWLKFRWRTQDDAQGVPCTNPWMLKAIYGLEDHVKKAIERLWKERAGWLDGR